MTTLTTAIVAGTAALLAVPVLALAATTQSPACDPAIADLSASPSLDPQAAAPPGAPASRKAQPACPDVTGRWLGWGSPAAANLPVSGTSAQVARAIAWALGQLGTPYSYGGDCTAPHSGNPQHQCDCSCLVILS
jgi:cell wall-associated NlpC family hydrolase